MATEATEGPTGVVGDNSRDEESGRFLIERRTEPMLPPAGPVSEETDAAAALDDELESVVIEAVAVAPTAARPSSRPKSSLPPPVPPAASVRPLAAEAAVADAVIPALTPNYRGITISDHVELRFDDLSLDLENNPYTRSSLVPPAPKPRSVGRMLLGATVLVALAAGSAMFLRTQPENVAAMSPVSKPRPVAVAVVHSAAPAAVAAVVEAPSVAVVAPAQVEVPAAVAVANELAEPAKSSSAVPAHTDVVEGPKAAVIANDTQAVVTPSAVEAPATDKPAIAAVADTAAVPAPAEAPAPVAAEQPAEPTTATDVKAPASTELAETLSREDVMTGFEKLRADITTCAAGGHGQTTAKVTIAGSGRVTYAMIEGAFAGTPEGSCMALVVRKATFPSFASATLKVAYPFAL